MKPNMIVEVNLKIPVDYNDWSGWRGTPIEVKDFIERVLSPYFPKMETSASGDMEEETVKKFLEDL